MEKSFWFGVFLLGFSSILTQIVVLREAMAGFYGNELIIGVVLANWLLLTGLGTYFGRRFEVADKFGTFAYTQVFKAFLGLTAIFLIRFARAYFFTPGEIIGFIQIFLYSLVILLPFCVVSGFQFTLATLTALSEKKREGAFCVSKVYVVDCMGHLVSGFFFSFVLVYFFNSFQTMYLMVVLNLLSALFFFRDSERKFFTALVLAAFIVFIGAFDLERISTELQFPGQKLLHQENSIYGKLVVTETEGQLNFYENAFPLFTTESIYANEERVHYAMLQHPRPENVLLISGAVSGTAREVLKYDPKRVDYVELDPKIIAVGREYTRNLDDERINVYNADGRLFVKKIGQKYDVVLIGLPDPSSVQVNRFYTVEFLRDVKEILNPGGIVALSLSGGENYLNEEAKNLNSALYQTLGSIFQNVLIVPGATNYFMASDAPLDYVYMKKIREKNIETKYFEYYLAGKLTEDRINYVYDAVKEEIKLNRDFTPITHFYYFSYWMSMFKINYRYLLVLVILVSLYATYISKVKPIPLTIFVTGFTSMALELVLIVSFQILYGYVYNKIGLLVAAFMLGDVLGAYFANRSIRGKSITPKTLSKFDFLLFAYCIILPVILLGIARIRNPELISLSAEVLIPALIVVIGVLAGIEFPLAVKIHLPKTKNAVETASILYSVDLFGACVGALLLSVLLIPLLGVIKVSLFVGFLNLASGLYIWFKEK